MPTKLPREMTGAELNSMLKSSVNFKSLGGMRVPGLKLSEDDLKWWRDAKIGMFIHWGLYSLLGRGEWAYFNEKIPEEEYAALAGQFQPQDFSTDEWAETALDLGARYAVMVTRHHDGFALWDSSGSYRGFTSMNAAAHRDFVREYTDSCRKYGLKTGYYYSPMDWRFPGYFDPVGLKDNALLMKKQCYAQVEELVTRYGTPDILWYDGGWLAHKGSDTSSSWFWEPDKLNAMVRAHAPKVIINPRSGWEGDFYCDEGSHEVGGKLIPVPWEKNLCLCSGASWGWMPEDPVQPLDWLIRMLVNVICRDGNILWNIAPDRNGKLSDEIHMRIHEFGTWIRQHGEAIYGTRGGPIDPVDKVFGATFRENIVYLHIFDPERFSGMPIHLPGKVLSAATLDGTPVRRAETDVGVSLSLEGLPPETDTILRVTLDRKCEAAVSDVYFTGKA